MQSISTLEQALAELPETPSGLFFTLSDLRPILPELSTDAFKALLSRAAKSQLLRRVCRGIYTVPKRSRVDGYELYHIAARLRAHEFNYISLESVLSDAGVISQIPMQWVTIMSSGRSQVIECDGFGRIEFIHTKKKPEQLTGQLTYDAPCHLWRASVALAIEDMKATRRDLDLLDWSVANELI